MADADRLSELLLRWQELRRQGVDCRPEQLCEDNPELLDDLKSQIVLFESMEALLETTASGSGDAPELSDPGQSDELSISRRRIRSGMRERNALPCIDGYDVVRELGRGGMGIVYRAVQKSTKRTVALKVMLHGRFASKRQRLRFEREVDLVASLQHPNIVTVYDGGVTGDGLQYYAMKYIRGRSLKEHVRDLTTVEQRLNLIAKICRAVSFAHQRGVIHRDLKPDNIRIDSSGEPHILDFGLAKSAVSALVDDGNEATQSGEFVGTLAYASPEQTKGDPNLIDIRSDVYSLGVIAYEVLTGGLPYPVTGQLADVLKVIAEKQPEPPSLQLKQRRLTGKAAAAPSRSLDERIDAIVLKALNKDCEGRYQSAGALAEDLERYLAGQAIMARPPSIAFLLRAWLKQNVRATALTMLIGTVCGALIAAFAFFATGGRELLTNCAGVYTRFPSQSRPWFLPSEAPASWVYVVLGVLGTAALLGIGPLVALAVRPKTRWDEVIAGGAAGIAAGLSAFFTCVGWAAMIGMSLLPAHEELHIMREMVRTEPGPIPSEPSATLTLQTAGAESALQFLDEQFTDDRLGRIAKVQIGPSELRVYNVGFQFVMIQGIGYEHPESTRIFDHLGIDYDAKELRNRASGKPVELWSPPFARLPASVRKQSRLRPSDLLLARYPELEAFSPAERMRHVMTKTLADAILGAQLGIWIGLVSSLFICGTVAVSETLVAGWLLRTGQSLLMSVLHYLEMVLPLLLGVWVSPAVLSDGLAGFLAISICVAWAVLAAAAVRRHWQWHVHAALIVNGFAVLSLFEVTFGIPASWVHVAAVNACLLVGFLHHHRRRLLAYMPAVRSDQ